MSRTYHKNVSIGICCGNNRKWYKWRRRYFRRKFNSSFRNLLSNFDIKTVSEKILNPKYPKRDIWNEPTDGRALYNKDIIKNKLKQEWTNKDYLKKICSKYLKFKLKKNN